MNQGGVVKEAVVWRPTASLVAAVGRCIGNKAGDCRKTETFPEDLLLAAVGESDTRHQN